MLYRFKELFQLAKAQVEDVAGTNCIQLKTEDKATVRKQAR